MCWSVTDYFCPFYQRLLKAAFIFILPSFCTSYSFLAHWLWQVNAKLVIIHLLDMFFCTSGILYSISCLTCFCVIYSLFIKLHSAFCKLSFPLSILQSVFFIPFSVLWGIRMIPDQFDGSDHIWPITENMYFTMIGIIMQFWRLSEPLNFWRWFWQNLSWKIPGKYIGKCPAHHLLPQKTKLLLAKREEEQELNK